MTLWMLWATGVTLMLGCAAALSEPVLRRVGWPSRLAWLGALGASGALITWSLVRPAPRVTPLADAPAGLGEALAGAVWGVAAAPSWTWRELLAPLDAALPRVWLAGTLLLGLGLVIGLVRLSLRARRWPRASVGARAVLVSEDFGPALLGILTPRIVLPRWAFALGAERLALACLHEDEHRRAHDGVALLVSALVTALMPWNVGAWWIARRLRLAVELDCDARVLAAGVEPSAYGALLLQLGMRRRGDLLPVAALSITRSTLERRLAMMLDDVRPARPGAAALSMLASCALVFAACEAPPPTAVSSEPASEASEAGDGPEARGVVRKMDPSAAAAREAAAVVGELARQAGVARYFVDGEAVDDLRSAIDSRPIDRIEVRRPVPDDPEGAKAIYVYTEPAAAEGAADEGSAPGKGGAFRLREARPSGASDQTGSTIRIRGLPSGGPGADASGPAPIIYVDGVRIDGGDANAVPRDRIDRVEIVKGGAAAELYGPEAAGGVILITTKPEAGPRG